MLPAIEAGETLTHAEPSHERTSLVDTVVSVTLPISARLISAAKVAGVIAVHCVPSKARTSSVPAVSTPEATLLRSPNSRVSTVQRSPEPGEPAAL